MTFNPLFDETSSEAWRLAVLERAKVLERFRQETQKRRNQEVLDWMDTQPPEIQTTSIGK